MMDSFPNGEEVCFILTGLLDRHFEKMFCGMENLDCNAIVKMYDKIDTFLWFIETHASEHCKDAFYYRCTTDQKELMVAFLIYVFQFPEYQSLNTVEFHKRISELFSVSHYRVSLWSSLCNCEFKQTIGNELTKYHNEELIRILKYRKNEAENHNLYSIRLMAAFMTDMYNTKYPCDTLFLNQFVTFFHLLSDREQIVPIFKQWCLERYPEGILQWM